MRDWLSLRRAATPSSTALVAVSDGRTWTYRELDDAVDATAGRLASAGVERGDRVGVVMETRPAFVRLVWAVQRLGAVLVPVNARLTAPEMAAQVERVDAVVLVTDADHHDTATEAAGDVPVLSVDEGTGDVTALDSLATAPVKPAAVPPTEPWVVMFTSGTTGSPKAVRLTRANFLASATASAFRLGVLPEDRWLLCLPMYHMGGLSVPVRTTIYGTTTVLHEGFDANGVGAALSDYEATGVSLVPTMLSRLLDDGGLSGTLRFALVGGGATDPDLVRRARDAGVPIHTTYGMTETTSQIATATPREVDEAPETVGRPLGSVEVAILDDGERLDPGEVGEIAVRGYAVTPGYLAGEATRDGWFATGDLGYRDEDGRLFVVGRASERIVTGGENVAPPEVVRAIESHPDVTAAAVVGLPDPEWGERVAALVVADDLSRDELDDYLAGRLAGYKRPRTVAFADDLPRTPSGTVDREAVRARLRDAEP
ncbi:MAG: o-succinylbenzoate--CoA ligase [Halanaeroarchaeum sp.]